MTLLLLSTLRVFNRGGNLIKIITDDPSLDRMFDDIPEITTTSKGFSHHKASAIVSAANSFGIMDGGSDVAIIDVLGKQVERDLQAIIRNRYYNELHVGQAIVLPIVNEQYKFLISASTMRVPKDINCTSNIYLAMRAILIAMRERSITSLVMPLLGTGYGRVSNRMAAHQICMAWYSVQDKIMSFDDIYQSEHDIYNMR